MAMSGARRHLVANLSRHLHGASRADGMGPAPAEAFGVMAKGTEARPIITGWAHSVLCTASTVPPASKWQHSVCPWHGGLRYSSSAQAAAAAGSQESQCWKCTAHVCKRTLPNFFCGGCHVIQPPPEATAESLFEVMAEEPRFDIDVERLEQKYKQLQKSLHPDKFATSPQVEQSYSAEYSSLVNQSYNVLRDPLQRANLLLKLEGFTCDADDEKTLDDPELLMETMEVREAVEEASSHDRLVELLDGNRSQQKDCKQSISKAFRDRDRAAAVAAVQRLTYLYRISEEIVKKM